MSTPEELGRLVEMLHAGDLASPASTAEHALHPVVPKGGTIPGGTVRSFFGVTGPLYEEMKALEGALAGDLRRWEALADRS